MHLVYSLLTWKTGTVFLDYLMLAVGCKYKMRMLPPNGQRMPLPHLTHAVT